MESSEQSPGTDDTQAAAAQAASEPTGMNNLAELLAAGEPDESNEQPGGDNAAESSGSDEKTKPTKFNDLAGATDMELDALYKLEVSLDGDDEPVTIEQLKDSYKERSEFDLRVIEFEETRTQQESELLRAKAELQEILQALPKNAVRPEVLQKIRDKSEATLTAERAKTLDVIPEWKDQDRRESDLAAMTEHLQAYGFPMNYLQQVVSHQHFKYIRDNMLREQRVRAAIAKVRNGKPEKSAAAKPQKQAPKKGGNLANIERGTHRDKLAAIFSSVD